MMIPRHILIAAHQAGIQVIHHAPTDTHQIAGHRADRWYVLRNKPDAKPIVYLTDEGMSQVHGDDYGPSAYT